MISIESFAHNKAPLLHRCSATPHLRYTTSRSPLLGACESILWNMSTPVLGPIIWSDIYVYICSIYITLQALFLHPFSSFTYLLLTLFRTHNYINLPSLCLHPPPSFSFHAFSSKFSFFSSNFCAISCFFLIAFHQISPFLPSFFACLPIPSSVLLLCPSLVLRYFPYLISLPFYFL